MILSMKIVRSIQAPIRSYATWEEQWKGADQGIIACWERGRAMRIENPERASQALLGQLVVLPWKGGVDKAIKKQTKYGTHFYLAMWQGLRGDDLEIDPEGEAALTCSATAMTVIFTSDYAKYANA